MSESKKPDTEIVKINKWDGAATKNAVDDAVREETSNELLAHDRTPESIMAICNKVLTGELKCTESFALIDGRLFLCALAVGIALYALLWDYLYPFPQSKIVLIVCVSSYFILMGILTLYTTFKEKGIFVVAKEKVGNVTRVWEVSSNVKKHDDKYQLIIVLRDSSGKCREAVSNKSIAYYIDVNGSIVQSQVVGEVTKLYNSLISDKKDK